MRLIFFLVAMLIASPSFASGPAVWWMAGGNAVTGQATYAADVIGAGTFTWVCPAGVTSVSVVAVGNGVYSGGGLGWKNNISVVPGNSYTVVVGAGALLKTSSYFISPSTVAGNNGTAYYGAPGGGFTGDGGGSGGTSGDAGDGSYTPGFGGAGGYTGGGGSGGSGDGGGPSAGGSGSGGGGGGGGGSVSFDPVRGGGVGLKGSGSSGVGGYPGADGQPGSSGTGAMYGGGNDGYGYSGAVRIIWPGTTRQFPSTNTGDM